MRDAVPTIAKAAMQMRMCLSCMVVEARWVKREKGYRVERGVIEVPG